MFHASVRIQKVSLAKVWLTQSENAFGLNEVNWLLWKVGVDFGCNSPLTSSSCPRVSIFYLFSIDWGLDQTIEGSSDNEAG